MLFAERRLLFFAILHLHSDCYWHCLTTHGACAEVRMPRLNVSELHEKHDGIHNCPLQVYEFASRNCRVVFYVVI